MYWTVEEALAHVDYPKAGLLKGLKAKDIAGFQTETGEWLIEAEPFTRDYHNYIKPTDAPLFHIVVEKRDATRQVEHLQDVLDVERARIAELKADRDRWAAIADRLIGLTTSST